MDDQPRALRPTLSQGWLNQRLPNQGTKGRPRTISRRRVRGIMRGTFIVAGGHLVTRMSIER